MSVKDRKMEQGFLESNKRPACSNCTNNQDLKCGIGWFNVSYQSWCACWHPSEEWISDYPSVWEKMKNSSDVI
jgi:hypothetical protein